MSALVSSMFRASVAHETPSTAAAEIAGRVLASADIPRPMTDAALIRLLALAAELGMQHRAGKQAREAIAKIDAEHRDVGADIVKRFTQYGDFAAIVAAELFLLRSGFTLGPMQKGSPRGIIFNGELPVKIAKWRDIPPSERRRGLHGDMVGGRHGPVTVTIYAEAPPEARAAFIAAERSGGA